MENHLEYQYSLLKSIICCFHFWGVWGRHDDQIPKSLKIRINHEFLGATVISVVRCLLHGLMLVISGYSTHIETVEKNNLFSP